MHCGWEGCQSGPLIYQNHPAAFLFYASPISCRIWIDKKDQLKYVVPGGVAVPEHQCNYLTREIDKIAQSIDPDRFYDIEFHASEILSRRSWPWDKMKKEQAREILKASVKCCY
jgi:hypothetical protein